MYCMIPLKLCNCRNVGYVSSGLLGSKRQEDSGYDYERITQRILLVGGMFYGLMIVSTLKTQAIVL